MDWLLGAIGGLVAGLVVAFVAPTRRWFERLGRRTFHESPVDVHVESDQALIWAGHPPWMSFSYFFPGRLPDQQPPPDGKDWSQWAARNGGYDLHLTMLVVTVAARSEVTVVLETPRLSAIRKDVPAGVGVIWPAPGGADLNPRRYQIELGASNPAIIYLKDEASLGEAGSQPPPSWKLGPGDVEQLHIWAKCELDDLYEWTLDLPFLVDGRRKLVHVDNQGNPFITVGIRQPHQLLYRTGDEWSPTV